MVDEDDEGIGLFGDAADHAGEPFKDDAVVHEVVADVVLERIDPDNVGLVGVDGVLEECPELVTHVAGDAVEEEAVVEVALLNFGEAEAFGDALDLFGHVTHVIFALDDVGV